MENKDIKVSVIMPVYNSGIYLKTAVESILNQSLKEIELILVDDGSTDGSSEQCDDYAQQDSRVVVIHQKNAGICNARNVALKIAKGEYIGFSDHDDKHHPDMLRDNYEIAKTYELDFIKFCKRTIEIKKGKTTSVWDNHFEKQIYERFQISSVIFRLAENRLLSCVWDCLFRNEFLKNNNIMFDPFFKMGDEDFDFMNNCFLYVSKFGTNDRCYYYHYIRYAFSTSTKYAPNKLEVLKRFPNGFLKVMKSLSMNPIDYRQEYAYFITKYYLSPVLRQLNKKDWSIAEKKTYLRDVKCERFWFDFISSTILPPVKCGIYSPMLFLYNLKMFRIALYFTK